MTDPTEIYQISPDENILVHLPHGIGHVEIRTTDVNGATGHPVIGVEVHSKTEHSDAADGRRYRPIFETRDDTVVLIGEPGPRMIEQEKQARWVEQAFAKHNSGDHSSCPDNCPVKEN